MSNDFADVHAEQCVIGSLLLDPRLAVDAAANLRVEDFYRGAHRRMYQRILEMLAEGVAVDTVTLADRLDRHGELDDVGGAIAVVDVAAAVPTAGNYKHYRNIVVELGRRRMLADLTTEMREALGDRDVPAQTVAARFGERLTYDHATSQNEGWQVWKDDEIDLIPPPTWIIEDILPEGLSFLYGPSNAGKSFVAVDMALSMVYGKRFFHKPVSTRPVLYWAGEGGPGYRGRRRSWISYNLSDGQQGGGFHLFSAPLDMMDPGDVSRLTRLTEEKRVGLVIIDTMQRAMSGDESDSRDVSKFIRACDLLRHRTGASVMVVHHEGKDATRGMRGSSAIYASSEAVIRVARPAADSPSPELARQMRVECAKMKDAEWFPTMHADLTATGDSAVLTHVPSHMRNMAPPTPESGHGF